MRITIGSEGSVREEEEVAMTALVRMFSRLLVVLKQQPDKGVKVHT
jgi:hypothetical protein